MAQPDVLLNVERVNNTQLSIQNRIDGGRGYQVDLLEWTTKLLSGHCVLKTLPRIRVCRCPTDGKIYSIDNRRLFVLKALYLNQKLPMRRMHWSHEFDCKLNGDGGGPWPTDEQGLVQFRGALLRHLNRRLQANGDVQNVFIPVGVFGQSIHDVLGSLDIYTEVDEIHIPPREPLSAYLIRDKRVKVSVDINPWSQPHMSQGFDYFGEFAIHLQLRRHCDCDRRLFETETYLLKYFVYEFL